MGFRFALTCTGAIIRPYATRGDSGRSTPARAAKQPTKGTEMQTATTERNATRRKDRTPRVETADKLLTLDDIAVILGVSRRTVERMRAAGEMPKATIIGRRAARWKRSQIDAFIERRAGK